MAARKKAKKARKVGKVGKVAGAMASKFGGKRTPPKSPVPKKLFAQASPMSAGGVSMFEAQEQIHADSVSNFLSDEELSSRAALELQRAGFDVLQVTQTTINIAGTKDLYERTFNTKILGEERPVLKEQLVEDTATFWDCPDTAVPGLIETRGTAFEGLLEGIAIEEPRYFMAPPSMFAPLKSYWHLRVPADVSLALNADKAHRSAITGRGVKVAMVDSGWFKHPYFVGRGYSVAPVVLGPSATLPLKDESGHGTGESANIFAAAPDCELLPVKMNFVNSIGAFNAAIGLNPAIITCSWGSSIQFGPLSAADQALAAAIAAAVAAGIVVIFSAGNGHFGFPGQHPDVISAGGTFMKPDESLIASNYSSGFASNIYAGRNVPDVCGLVGQIPKAIYLMLPLEPQDQIDVGNANGTHPNGDETTSSDGWAAFSGTSAAAPQLAGVAALVKQACPGLTPVQVKDILKKSARDVIGGTSNASTGGHAAVLGPDLATGTGLVDAHKAVLLAKVKCLGPTPIKPIAITPIVPPKPPIVPIHPIQPITPITPIKPITPIIPIQPIKPITPITPIQPIKPPITPIKPPITPIRPPIQPIQPIKSVASALQSDASSIESATIPEESRGRLTDREVQHLEQMIMESDTELE